MNRFFPVLFLFISMQSLFAADGADVSKVTPEQSLSLVLDLPNVSGVVQKILGCKHTSGKELSLFVHKQIQGLSYEGMWALCSSDEIQTSSLLPIVSASIVHEYATVDRQGKTIEDRLKGLALVTRIHKVAAWAENAYLWDVAFVNDKNDERQERKQKKIRSLPKLIL
jgi:hypothetical protein